MRHWILKLYGMGTMWIPVMFLIIWEIIEQPHLGANEWELYVLGASGQQIPKIWFSIFPGIGILKLLFLLKIIAPINYF